MINPGFPENNSFKCNSFFSPWSRPVIFSSKSHLNFTFTHSLAALKLWIYRQQMTLREEIHLIPLIMVPDWLSEGQKLISCLALPASALRGSSHGLSRVHLSWGSVKSQCGQWISVLVLTSVSALSSLIYYQGLPIVLVWYINISSKSALCHVNWDRLELCGYRAGRI